MIRVVMTSRVRRAAELEIIELSKKSILSHVQVEPTIFCQCVASACASLSTLFLPCICAELSTCRNVILPRQQFG